MNLSKYKLIGWDGKKIKQLILYDNFEILLLDIELIEDPPESGRRNLLATNKVGDIMWVADLPDEQKFFGFYNEIKLDGINLKAWCGSFFCEINPNTGQILKVEFVRF